MLKHDAKLDEAARTCMAISKGLGWNCYLHFVKNNDAGTGTDVQSYGNLSERDLTAHIKVLLAALEDGVYGTRTELSQQ